MTTADLVLSDWALTTAGKTARLAIAVLGMVVGTLTLMLAPAMARASWLLVLAGISLAATSVRAARLPTVTRLAVVAVNLLLIPLLAQLS